MSRGPTRVRKVHRLLDLLFSYNIPYSFYVQIDFVSRHA